MIDEILMSVDIDIPMTIEQRRSLLIKYIKDNNGQTNFVDFCTNLVSSMNGYIVLKWCGMFVAIEKDGYSHT